MSGFAPLAHGIYLFGWSQMLKQSGMPYYLAEGGFLCLGALVYAVSLEHLGGTTSTPGTALFRWTV